MRVFFEDDPAVAKCQSRLGGATEGPAVSAMPVSDGRPEKQLRFSRDPTLNLVAGFDENTSLTGFPFQTRMPLTSIARRHE